jgi:hypothetical protein
MYAVFEPAAGRGGPKSRSRAIAVIVGAAILAATTPAAYSQISEFEAAASPLARFAFTGTFRFQLPKTVTSGRTFTSRRPRVSRTAPPKSAIVAVVIPVTKPPHKKKIKPADQANQSRQLPSAIATTRPASPGNVTPATATAPIATATLPPAVRRQPPPAEPKIPAEPKVELDTPERKVARVTPNDSQPTKTGATVLPKTPIAKTPEASAGTKPVKQHRPIAPVVKRDVVLSPSQRPSLSRQARSALGAPVPAAANDKDKASKSTTEIRKPIAIATTPDRAAIKPPVKPQTIVAAAPAKPETASQAKPPITRARAANLPPLPTAYQRPGQLLTENERSTRATAKTRSRLSSRARRRKSKKAVTKKAKSSNGDPAWMRNVLGN